MACKEHAESTCKSYPYCCGCGAQIGDLPPVYKRIYISTSGSTDFISKFLEKSITPVISNKTVESIRPLYEIEKETKDMGEKSDLGYCMADVMATASLWEKQHPNLIRKPKIKKVIFNAPATIIIWKVRIGFDTRDYLFSLLPTIMFAPWPYRYPGQNVIDIMWLNFYISIGEWCNGSKEKKEKNK